MNRFTTTLCLTALIIMGTAHARETTWGEAVNGVSSRLSLVTEKPVIGQPIVVKLELRNSGAAVARFDSQQAAVNNSLTVRDAQGQVTPFIARPYQTLGGETPLQPNETKVIFDKLDVASQYLIDRPGKYTLQFKGRNGLPTSNVLEVTVGPGKLDDGQRLFAAIQRRVPGGWRATYDRGTVLLIHSPTGLKADVSSISLYFMKDKANQPKPQPGQPAPIDLGETTLGHAWLVADSQRAVDNWPNYAKVIGEQIKVYKKGA